MDNFKISSANISNPISPKLEIDDSPTIDTNSYHKEELEMNKVIIINSIFMIWVGIITIIVCIACYIFKLTDNFYIGISGVFIDFFSGTILYLVNNSTKTKNEYFKESAKVDSERRIVKLIESSTDETFRQKQIAKLVENYCQGK